MQRMTQLISVMLIVSFLHSCGELQPTAPQSPYIDNQKSGRVQWQLHRFDGKSWVNCMAFGNEEEVWASLYGKGLARLDAGEWVQFSQSNSSLPSDSVLSLATDHDNNLWAGTTQGLVKYDGETWTIYNNENTPLPTNSIRALAVDNNNVLWVGCVGRSRGGMAAFDGESWAIYTSENSDFNSRAPGKIVVDKNNTKWVGVRSSLVGAGGLAKFENRNWTIFTPENSDLLFQEVQDMTLDNNGNVWLSVQEYYAFGTYIESALIKFDGSSWQNIRVTPNQFYSALGYSTIGNYLWTAQSSNPALSPITYAISILNEPQWIGLYSLDPQFPQVYIFDIQSDKNDAVWLASTMGIIEVEPLTRLPE